MTRRSYYAAGGVLAVLLAASACTRQAAPTAPDVVLITIDTLRADHLSAYGHSRRTSPHLDQLAERGALFENCYAAANNTNPSHTSILTGTRVLTHGVIDTPQTFAREDIPLLSERFRTAGYATAAVVSARHLNREPSGLGRGFDQYIDVEPQATERRAEPSVALARQWITAHAAQPFFLWLHVFDPHMPYDPPPPYDARYVTTRSPRLDVILGRDSAEHFFQTQPASDRERAFLQQQFALQFEDSIGFNQLGMTSDEVGYLTSLYDGEVAYADAMLGSLLADLDRLDLANKTLVVVTADHGEAFGEHGIYCSHRTIYEETLRVPLIFRYPGHIPAGRRIQAVASGIDVAPTILQYAGLPMDSRQEGRSLAPAIDGVSDFSAAPIFAEHAKLYASMVRSGPWKLIFSRPTVKEERIAAGQPRGRVSRLHPKLSELYNLVDDPHENSDLADAHPEIVQQLLQLREARVGRAEPSRDIKPVDAETQERLRALGYTN